MLPLVLATKLYIPPPRPKVVTRPRLIERLAAPESLSAGRMPGVTLISAPAGFGKTTLVSEWVNHIKDEGGTLRVKDEATAIIHPAKRSFIPHAKRSKVAWLSLDEADNDPARFMAYLVAALRTIQHLPPQIRLVITTREDPPIPLARLRARGQLTELRPRPAAGR